MRLKKFKVSLYSLFRFLSKSTTTCFIHTNEKLIFYRCPYLADRMHPTYWQFMENNLQMKTTQRDINGEAFQEYFVCFVPLLCYILRFVTCTNTLVKPRKEYSSQNRLFHQAIPLYLYIIRVTASYILKGELYFDWKININQQKYVVKTNYLLPSFCPICSS